MSDVYNAIQIGFPWSQDLVLPEGAIEEGDGLRAELRYTPEDAEPIAAIASEGNDGITIEGLTVTLTLSAGRSALIARPATGKEYRIVLMDLVRILAGGGGEQHLGFRLRIPAVTPITRAAA